jgi:hypothetical protein
MTQVQTPQSQQPQQASGFAVGSSIEAKDISFKWKEYEKQFTSKKVREQLAELAFPEDDVEVIVEKKILRTARSSVLVRQYFPHCCSFILFEKG